MIEIRKGTIQSNRINDHLLNQEFKIDNRSFEDLLGYIISYLEYINFYKIDNKIDGNWKTLVENDPVIYMVSIIKEPTHNVTFHETPLKTAYILLEWYSKIDEWRINLFDINEKVLANKIENIVSDVLKFKKKDILYYIKSKEEEATSEKPSEYLKIAARLTKQVNERGIALDEIVNTFKELIIHIQDFTREYLKSHIFEKNDHMPNNAMYIAFVLLYKKIQKQLNGLSQRHLDFYYKDVLQQKLSKGKATQAVICFELMPKVKSALISKGITLTAGKLFESKAAVIFETNEPLVATPVVLESVKTLYFNKNPYVKIGTNDAIISNIIKNNLLSKGVKLKDADNYSLFGANQDTIINSQITQKSITNVGFMIGSQALFLEEGEREITISFKLEERSSKDVFWKLINQIKTNENLPLDVVFNMVFEETFIISYTSVKGWETVTSYNLLLDEETNDFSVCFTLESIAPPLTNLASEAMHSIFPMIKMVFDEYAPIYAYSFFKGVNLESITIDVCVTGIKNLSLYNNNGKLPLTKPFDLFGPLPAISDYLMIGKSELFKKELTALDIHIDWNIVPEDYGGFDTYYEEYSEAFTNNSFEIEITALSNGFWFPREEHPAQKTTLFTTESCSTPEGYDSILVSKNRTITIDDVSPYKLSRDYKLKDPIKNDIHTQGGFFKLSLTNPQYAFGQKVYQKDYAEIALYNAKNKESLPLPNKPFVPKVNQLRLDYKARDVISFTTSVSNNNDGSGELAGDYMHITPSGIHKIVHGNKVHKSTMVSDYKGEGYLYIVISGLAPDTSVSLFFDLLNNNPLHSTKPDNIIYQYKKLDNWMTLPENYIISDTTNQFTKSGIIELMFPDDSDPNSDGKYELRFVAVEDAYVYPVINGIYSNAVTATCISDNPTVIGKNVEAYSITKAVQKIAALKKVTQPAASYGGKIPEAPELFYTQVSERLRHKDRAVTLWDYEHLILQYFHEVIAVKCTNLDKKFKPQAGKVRIVVLNSKWNYKDHQYFNANELDEMTQFIQRKATSFIKIKAQNPTIEWLLVNCVVEFEEEDNSGYFMEKLNTVINEYLCPLTHNKVNNTQGIGAEVIPIMLTSHIENLPYIKSVQKLNIEHIVHHGLNNFTMETREGSYEIQPTTPWSMLVPKLKHNIFLPSVLKDETIQEVEMQNLQIGVDFIIVGDSDFRAKEAPVAKVIPEKEVTKKAAIIPRLKSNTILTFKNK